MLKDISEKAVEHITTTSYAAGGGTILFGFFKLSDIALAVGIICTIATFALSHIYRVKHYNLAKERFDHEKNVRQNENTPH